MGMLDNLAYDDREVSFPNFGYSYGSQGRESSLQLNQINTNSSSSSASSTSSSSSYGSSTSSRDSAQRVAFHTPRPADRRTSSKSSRQGTPQLRRARTSDDRKQRAADKEARRKSANFDLSHDDEELQEAESYLYWCETCLKHCDVASHRMW